MLPESEDEDFERNLDTMEEWVTYRFFVHLTQKKLHRELLLLLSRKIWIKSK